MFKRFCFFNSCSSSQVCVGSSLLQRNVTKVSLQNSHSSKHFQYNNAERYLSLQLQRNTHFFLTKPTLIVCIQQRKYSAFDKPYTPAHKHIYHPETRTHSTVIFIFYFSIFLK